MKKNVEGKNTMNETVSVTSENKIIPYLKFGIIAGLVIFLYFPEIKSLIYEWSTKKECSHGFLIPLISLYIIWKKRGALKLALVVQNWEGYFILISGLMILLIGRVSYEPFAMHVSLLVTMCGLVYFLLGKRILRILLFPLVYLIFMIPPPYIIINTIAVHLRLIDAKITYLVISFLGIPLLREGPNLHLPNITLDVAYLCTGILSLVSMVALSVFYAYLFLKHIISRTALIVLALPIAFAGNILRIILITALTYYFGEIVLHSVIHQFQGVVIFIMNILLLVILGSLLRKVEKRFLIINSS